MNHFGNPLVPGGTCEACICNNNINIDIPDSCDASTGECLKCQYNTEGFNCERCRPGFFGDATRQNCQECVCNLLGTDQQGGHCDQSTGQCPCLPNVIGLRCDRCAPNHWGIASGLGCEPCDCDLEGSLTTQCNEFDGKCQCRPGRGGRTCSECEANSWGDPNVQCYPCDCNPLGSATNQCDRRTGQCQCLPGIAGDKCDRCDRGTTGELPNCRPCGECFDNWDRIIKELKNETDILINQGSNIKVGGAPGAFEEEFRRMEEMLNEVRAILAGANVTGKDLDELRDKLSQIRQNLTASSGDLDNVDGELSHTSNRIETANNRIETIKRRIDALKRAAEQLRQNATNIRELDVGGAYNSTKESQRRSRDAAKKVEDAGSLVRDSEVIRGQIDDLLDSRQDDFDQQYRENENNLRDLNNQVQRLDDKIIDLNEEVCDGRGDPCDSLCGGAGCGKCGGPSCDDGAVTKANNALDLAKRADEVLMMKEETARSLLNDVKMAQDQSNLAKREAQIAYQKASLAKNTTEADKVMLEDLLKRITDFLGQQGARPADIRAVAEEVLGMSISLTPDQIRDLAQQISETIRGLTDIDAILDATRDDLLKAQRLKDRADMAKREADEVRDTAHRVTDLLDEAERAQNSAEGAINDANTNIADAESDLAMIESETSAAGRKSNRTLKKVDDLQDRLDALKRKYLENEIKVQKAESEAASAERLADTAEENANDLEDKYNDVASQLDAKYNETREAKERADRLRDRAATLYQDTYEKIERLRVMESEFIGNEKTLRDLSEQITEMNRVMLLYMNDIKEIAKFHRTCTQ